jgi:hypothetical protein
VGRDVAVGDLFNDGKMDAVINVMDGPTALQVDVSPDKHNRIDIKLVGGPKSRGTRLARRCISGPTTCASGAM